MKMLLVLTMYGRIKKIQPVGTNSREDLSQLRGLEQCSTRSPRLIKKLDNELNDSVEIIDIGGEDDEPSVLRKDDFSLSTDVPRDYEQGSVGKDLNPMQRAVPMDPDQDNVDMLIGLSPNEKDLM